jgi:hypothetical protein
MVRRFGVELPEAELNEWLSTEPPQASLDDLGPGVDQLFIYEAMQLMEIDGDVADTELRALENIIDRVFEDRPKGTTLARIKVVKKRVPVSQVKRPK